jgi:hypothetical protein
MPPEVLHTVTYRIGEKIKTGNDAVRAQRNPPFIFNSLLGTDPKKLCMYEYDTVQVVNDSGNDIYFSLDGGRQYFRLGSTESLTWDECTNSLEFWAYAANANSAVRISLWKRSI